MVGPVSQQELETHLYAFIRSFVEPRKRARWIHCLIDQPKKSRELLAQAAGLDVRHCRKVLDGDSLERILYVEFANDRGVYWDGDRPAVRATVIDAWAGEMTTGDALYSVTPGRKALFFHHDILWRCVLRTD